ncbi:hypothetical protein ACLG6S_07295 [Thermodesulfobacteriota bacterium B35]
MEKITPAVFAKSFFYIGPGYDIEPLLRFTHLTDTFMYVNIYLSLREVLRWYDEQFSLHPDIEVVEKKVLRDFDETRHFTLHPDYRSHLMRPTFLKAGELEDYLRAFADALELPQWAVIYRLKRKSSGREITLYYLTAEGLASYIALSHNGIYAPRILATIRTNVLEKPHGPLNSFFTDNKARKPKLWIRGFMPDPPVNTDIFGEWEERAWNKALDPVGVFSRQALSFNHRWVCEKFYPFDHTRQRYCKGFVTADTARILARSAANMVCCGHGRHRLVRTSILSRAEGFTDRDVIVVPERIGFRPATRAQLVTWESVVIPRYDHRTKRAVFVSAGEQLDLLQQALRQRGVAADATIHIVPHCLEDEGELYFKTISGWSRHTVTYVTGLLDFIDQITAEKEDDLAALFS